MSNPWTNRFCRRERERSERDREWEKEGQRPTKSVTSQNAARFSGISLSCFVSLSFVFVSFHNLLSLQRHLNYGSWQTWNPNCKLQTANSKRESVSELKLRRKSLFGDHIGRIGWIQMRSFCKSPRSGNYKSLPKLYLINFSCDCVVIALSATWCGECTARKSRYSCKLKRNILCSYIFCYAWMDMPYTSICTYVCFSSMFNAMQTLPSFSCSAVAFVTNFIGVKKSRDATVVWLATESWRDFDCRQARLCSLCPSSSSLCLSPPALRLLLFAKFLFSLQALQNHRRRIQSDFSTLSLSFILYPYPFLGVTPAPSLAEL